MDSWESAGGAVSFRCGLFKGLAVARGSLRVPLPVGQPGEGFEHAARLGVMSAVPLLDFGQARGEEPLRLREVAIPLEEDDAQQPAREHEVPMARRQLRAADVDRAADVALRLLEPPPLEEAHAERELGVR